jgi:dCMP deaminase
MSAIPSPSSASVWDIRWLRLAIEVSHWSKDPSSKVGAVAVRERRILASGFNGFPVGMLDDERLADREQKYPRIVHAEQNVIAWAAREGVSLLGASLYLSPLHPCPDCAKLIVQAGFAEVVYLAGPTPERWADAMRLAGEVFAECGVIVRGVAP